VKWALVMASRTESFAKLLASVWVVVSHPPVSANGNEKPKAGSLVIDSAAGLHWLSSTMRPGWRAGGEVRQVAHSNAQSLCSRRGSPG
jgi:hypothetical protein